MSTELCFTGTASGISTRIDELLREQQTLTAVDKFSAFHAGQDSPAAASHYRDLLPLSAPRPGEQYAFEVDLDRCSSCKGCVTACHALNGLDEDESWRQVGQLVGETGVPVHAPIPLTRPSAFAEASAFAKASADRSADRSGTLSPMGERDGVRGRLGGLMEPTHMQVEATHEPTAHCQTPIANGQPLQQSVTTACHHCLEPACLLGCPVLAYDKDPTTGIVRHLDDQCIGCSYCLMMCPYEVPKYSARLGIVRKCDMCQDRLAVGEAPACVQACPNEAIRITLVSVATLRQGMEDGTEQASEPTPTRPADHWLADSPDPGITLPTTQYVSKKPNAHLLAADHGLPRVAAAHWPLVCMLTLTQAGMGGLLAAWSVAAPGGRWGGFVLFCLGLMASALHLGRPGKAWRVWLGWRTSWLSREAIVLNAWGAVALVGLMAWAGQRFQSEHELLALASACWFGLLTGLALAVVFAQTMVYAHTRREFWRPSSTGARFFGTTLLGAVALAFCLQPGAGLALALSTFELLKLGVEISVLKHADSDATRWTQLRRTAVLQRGPLRVWFGARLLLGLAGAVLIPALVVTGQAGVAWAWTGGVLWLLGEGMERYLFFASVAPDKMPGSA